MADRPSSSAKPTYPIASVDNALKLLRLFGERRWIRVSEASTELGVVRSTAHRLLAMLQYHGFIEQDPETKVYFAGPVLTDIGLAAFREIDIRGALRPLLEALADEFQETVQLVTLRGAEVQFLDAVESTRVLRTTSQIGVNLPAHCTAAGKVLLAELSSERLRDIYPSSKLEQRTEKSLSKRDALEAELVQIRKVGYAVQLGESDDDIGGVAVAVRGNGRPKSAIVMTAPITRLPKSRAVQIGKRLVGAAEQSTAEPETETVSV